MQARARLDANSRSLSRLEVSQPNSSADPIQCASPECSGVIQRVWWGGENLVFFLKPSGAPSGARLYTWNVTSGAVSLVASVEDSFLSNCDLGAGMRMVCVRETAELPPHLAFVDPGTGVVQVLVDVNPEFRNIALGKVERFEWDTPRFKWNEPGAPLDGIFPDRAQGYILYPPDFDAARKYPVFIHHYVAMGFDNIGNQEYALHAMAANGFIVLNLNVPQERQEGLARLGPGYAKLFFSEDLGFPRPSMYMESLLRALDTVAARGFIDEQHVGIGGVSDAAFNALYLIQKRDRIAAVSIGTGVVSQLEYYAFSLRGQKQGGTLPGWAPKPTGPGVDFGSRSIWPTMSKRSRRRS
jgi:dipeptidyl aminopeptidase/acylaminoacyl peptidase